MYNNVLLIVIVAQQLFTWLKFYQYICSPASKGAMGISDSFFALFFLPQALVLPVHCSLAVKRGFGNISQL